ncbi:cupin domain-containing protein [Methylobacterium sp. Leaf118]|uniref:cupin domain-containing protein n=1 Tax=Methylobacterium sp. Leaf118 TaxID=2876562 RepID=UPI001E589DD4|nr:cupin domain-containing protein [Methylobacterium sp. Leaf118]
MIARPNLFADLPPPGAPDEQLETLAAAAGARLERIVSRGQASPPGFWYDQADDEWVAVLAGAATLRFADAAEPLHLGPGDHVLIPAHRRHRVERTEDPTIWLAVHLARP